MANRVSSASRPRTAGGATLSPCGRCRELLAQVDVDNLDATVLLPEGRSTRLRELLPEPVAAVLGRLTGVTTSGSPRPDLHVRSRSGLAIRPVPSGLMRRQEKADRIGQVLDDLYPDPPVPLDHVNPYTLLVAVALSAQTTDKKVNQVTPPAVRDGVDARADGPARPGHDPRRDPRGRPGADEGEEHLDRRQPDRRRRRRGTPGLGLPRVARRGRPQDGERGDGAGVRRAGVRRSTRTSTGSRLAGDCPTARRSSAPSATSRRCSRRRRGTTVTSRSSSSAGSTARRCATTSTPARSVRSRRRRP